MANRIDRFADQQVRQLLEELPAVMVVGPRAIGKTTTATAVAADVVRADRPADAAALDAAPDAVLSTLTRPALIDEWQRVPTVLDAVKRSIDDDASPGQWILTGSVRADLLDASRAATGRIVRLVQWGLTERERRARLDLAPFFGRILADPESLRTAAPDSSVADIVDMALQSGFPEVTELSERARGQWLESYVHQTLTRDAADVGEDRDPVALRRYLVAYASNTAQVTADKTLYDAAGITRVTAVAYERLLEMLFVTAALPAWHTNQLKRLVKSSKRVLVEPAMMGPLLGVDRARVLRDGGLLGQVVETFVIAQLRAEASLGDRPVRLYHLRTDDGRHEIDLIAEYPDGSVAAIEIKATAAPTTTDARHLDWLADRLGDRLIAAVVLHTGSTSFPLGDRVQAMPIGALWGGRAG